MKKIGVRDRVLSILRKHPEGLTTVDLSSLVGLGRQSLAKYVYQLVGEGVIVQREIGTAKLCYLKAKKK
jgi:predicted transcriptional regulator